MSHSFNQNIRPAPTHQRVSREETSNHHQSVQPSSVGETAHLSTRLPLYPDFSSQDLLDRVNSITTSTLAPASTLAPLSSIPDTMSTHPSHLHNGPEVIPRHLRPRSGNYRSLPPAGQDTGVTHTPTSGANRSPPPAVRDASVPHTPASAAPDHSFRSTAWDNPVAYATDNRLPYPVSRPQTAPDNSMSQHAPAGGRSNLYPSRPADSENPLAYASNNESRYSRNATRGVSQLSILEDLRRDHQIVLDDRVLRHISHVSQEVSDNRAPHQTYPQGQYPAIETSSSYSVAQRWDSNIRPSAYQEPYRPYANNGPNYSGQYQEPVQSGRSMPAGYDAPPHHSFRDGRDYSQQPPAPPTYRHHSYQDSRGYPQQQPPPPTRHHSYNDERGYSQQQHPAAPSHHSYQDNRGYPQQQLPHPSHYPYHDGRGYPQDQPPAAQPPLRQSAPRQRTAIACKYCRRRKIRCSGFTADGSGGQCTNCARFKQECVFTPVSSAQAFVPLIALTEALNGRDINPGVFGAHGQRLPGDSTNQNSGEPYQGYHPQQAAPGPQMPYNHQQMPQQVAHYPPQNAAQYAPQHMQQRVHPTHLPPMNRSPHDRDTLPSPTGSIPRQTPLTHLPSLPNRSPYDQGNTLPSPTGSIPRQTPLTHLPSLPNRSPYDQGNTLPSPTGSLDSQKRKREADEHHFARAAPPAPGQFSGYSRENNAPSRISSSLQEQYQHRAFVQSTPTRQYGHQQGENALAYRPMEDGRQSTQWASVNSNEAPRNNPSPNGSSSSFHSQNPSGHHQPSQVSPYRSESAQFPLASPARTNSGGGNYDRVARETERPNQMNIANIVEPDDSDVDRDMLRRLGSNRP
ncbi:hypothetical protein BPOR_0155g00130 [Botrytis porri]|uniref:Zn(2)-C6 fungal-type domain-containing protein n=1 Tax=Botrytis porri TaxID=87229 RepID=A0A4Z1KVK4_9HELO|nr:hypothetical protein BPOR_0155g00130 [Botrytis porri]